MIDLYFLEDQVEPPIDPHHHLGETAELFTTDRHLMRWSPEHLSMVPRVPARSKVAATDQAERVREPA